MWWIYFLTWNFIILLFSSNHGSFVVSWCLRMRGRRKTKRCWEKEFKSTANKQVKKRALWAPGLGRFSANLRRLVRLSAPSWFRIPGSISVSCLFSACPVIVKVLAAKEAWTFGLLKWITVPWFVNIFTWSGGGVGSGGRKQFKVSVKEDNAQSKHPFPTISWVLFSWQQLVSSQMAYTTDSLLFPF